MEPIKIDKNVPVPPAKGRNAVYPLRELEVGDSFFVPEKKPTQLSTCSSQVAKRTGHKYQSRAVTENGVSGVRVWRVA